MGIYEGFHWKKTPNHSVVMDELVNLFSIGQHPIGFLGIPP
jgi:hypothetical protein